MDASLSRLSHYNKDNTQLQISQIWISKINISVELPQIVQQSWNKNVPTFFFFFFTCNILLASYIFIWWNRRIRAGEKKCYHGKCWELGSLLSLLFLNFHSQSKAGQIKPFDLSLLLLILCFGCNYLVQSSSSSSISEIWASNFLHQVWKKPVGGRTNPGLRLPGHHWHSQNEKLGVSIPIPIPQPQTEVKEPLQDDPEPLSSQTETHRSKRLGRGS